MRKPLMAGNWKMHFHHLEAIHLVQKLAFTFNDEDYNAVDIAVLPPFTSIRSVETLIHGDGLKIQFGSQDISAYESGAYTGEVSGMMLSKLGCEYSIVGHSERRAYHHETNELVSQKAKVALAHSITPIICVGESLEIRESGNHVQFTLEQLEKSIEGIAVEDIAKCVFAYEPVWAIGTGKVATAEDAEEVAASIRKWIANKYTTKIADQVRVLYGGSVKASNIAGIMAGANVDGALIGGASLDSDEFVAICRFRLH
ncbi:MAG: triose-phosphate isomerase [Candidatus Nanopelagicales bacterium]